MTNLYPHYRFEEPRTELRAALDDQARGRIIFLVGPTGVGKTTLRRSVVREIVGRPDCWGMGRIPAIEVLARLPKNAYFSSLSLAQSFVDQLMAPDVRWLQDSRDSQSPALAQLACETAEAKKMLREFPIRNMSEPKLWTLFARLTGEREVWLGSIDQAGAMCTNHKNTDPADHILNLMSIAEEANINFLLSGVHTTCELWAERPEVRRRSDVIWMRPYSYDRIEDRKSFLQLLRTFGDSHTFDDQRLLFKMAPELMAASAAIFGVLEKIFRDAKMKAALDGRKAIKKMDLEDSFYGRDDYKKLWDDVGRFEEAMSRAPTQERAKVVTAKWQLKKSVKPASKDDSGNEDVAHA